MTEDNANFDWSDYWIWKDSQDKWFHFWPDNTTFGPFETEQEAREDCKRRAVDYEP